MNIKLFVAIVLLLGVWTLPAQTPEGTKPKSTRVVTERSFKVSNWFNAGMLLEALELTPTLRYFDPETVAIMIPDDWEAERKQVARLEELKTAELAMFDSVKPAEKVVDTSTRTTKDLSLTTTTVYVGPVSPEKKTPPESIAIGQSLTNSIQGRLGADPIALWQFNLGRNVNLALNHADSRNDALRLEGVETFREFIKTAPPEIDKALIEEADVLAAIMTKGIFKPEDAVKVSASMSKIGTLIGIHPALPDISTKKP